MKKIDLIYIFVFFIKYKTKNNMFSIIENTIIIPPQFTDDIHKKLFNKYKNCDKIIFSNYTLFENIHNNHHGKKNRTTHLNDFYSKKYWKFYSDNISRIETFYQYKYIKSKYYLVENETEEEKKYSNRYDCIEFFKSSFNKSIDSKFPDEIKILVLGWYFNQSVNNLPISLKEIVFGYEFNQSVDNLPFTLEVITFGYSFNNPINNLPNSIRTIKLGYNFNQPIDDLPNTLEKIELGPLFDYPINNLPISLTEFTILSNYERYDIYKLPKKLENLTFVYIQDEHRFISKYNSENVKFKFCHNIFFY